MRNALHSQDIPCYKVLRVGEHYNEEVDEPVKDFNPRQGYLRLLVFDNLPDQLNNEISQFKKDTFKAMPNG